MDAQDASAMAAQGIRGTPEEHSPLLAIYKDASQTDLGREKDDLQTEKQIESLCVVMIKPTN